MALTTVVTMLAVIVVIVGMAMMASIRMSPSQRTGGGGGGGGGNSHCSDQNRAPISTKHRRKRTDQHDKSNGATLSWGSVGGHSRGDSRGAVLADASGKKRSKMMSNRSLYKGSSAWRC